MEFPEGLNKPLTFNPVPFYIIEKVLPKIQEKMSEKIEEKQKRLRLSIIEKNEKNGRDLNFGI